jgi:hypothetical protein
VVTIGHKEAARSGARVVAEEGDDKWGPPISQTRRGVKAAQGEAFSHEGGGNQAGRHRRAVGWAERASWAGRDAEAQWLDGGWGRLVGNKKNGPWLGRKAGWVG